jgi:excisionase family DNA binding protein
MEKYLNTQQVQEILKVDRITIYRMLNDGRLKGIKIGKYWRFPQNEINRLLGVPIPEPEREPPDELSDFPEECVHRLQEVFAGILGVGALTVNLDGDAISEPVYSNPFCRMMLSNPSSHDACKQSWRKIARHVAGNPEIHLCHAGLCYLRSAINLQEQTVAWMITGQFYLTSQKQEGLRAKIESVAEKHGFQLPDLEKAVAQIPVLKPTQQQKVLEWAPKVSDTVQSMMCERSDLVNRLERIAEISSIRTNLSKT